MSAILALAAKDLRILIRVKSGLFFTFAWPLIIAVLFGAVFSGSEDGKPHGVAVALADEDQTAASRDFAAMIAKGDEFDVQTATRAQAIDLVRHGKRAAALLIPKGFAEARQRLFYGDPPQIEVWIDPSRKAESAMIQGLLFQRASHLMEDRLSNPGSARADIKKTLEELNGGKGMAAADRAAMTRFLGTLDRALADFPASTAPPNGQTEAWQPLKVSQHDIAIQKEGPHSGYEVTFPQGLIWGVLGCAMTFGIGFISERTHGTLIRLRVSPMTRIHLLAGKALACAAACLLMQLMLCGIGYFGFHVKPNNWGLMALACISTVAAFVGIMMLVAGLGKTEQAAGGIGWALMMPVSLFGGGMVPLAFMPHWMAQVGVVSPVRWSILAFEGAIWRGFTLPEMLLPCGILVAVGLVCFAIGTRTLRLT